MANKKPTHRTPPPAKPAQKVPENRALSKKDKRRRKRGIYQTRVMRPED